MRVVLALFSLAAVAFAAEPKKENIVISDPVWLVAPPKEKVAETRCDAWAKDLPLDPSNCNLAIRIFKDRFYLAFRSAKHHHPKPPFWAATKEASTRTQMYVYSAPVAGVEWKDLGKTFCALKWQKEFEAGDKIKGRKGVPADYDLREPMFSELGGKLHFYFQQVEGKSMAFVPKQTWMTTFDGKEWNQARGILEPGELVWDVVEKDDRQYLTSYRGGHYSTSDKDLTRLYLRTSTDGVRWENISKDKEEIYVGGANEAAIAFDKDGALWSVIRHEDGGYNGWGTFVGKASKDALDDWGLPDEKKTKETLKSGKQADIDKLALAQPVRYDSPRLFVQDDEIFLIARRNVGIRLPKYDPRRNDLQTNLLRLTVKPDGEGELVRPDENYPFDLAFTNAKDEPDYEKGPANRLGSFTQLLKGTRSNKSENPLNMGFFFAYEVHYNFKEPKRTTLYWLNRETKRLVRLHDLPSAGDTAFPSIVKVGPGEFLVANYSSPFDKRDRSWGRGQQSPTGIYVVKISFR